MKIALLGNNQLTVSTAWGLSQSETAREIVFVTDAAANNSRAAHLNAATPGTLQDLVTANALATSDTTIAAAPTLEGLAGADVVILLPPIGQPGFRSPQAVKTTATARVRRFVTGIQQHAPNATVLVAVPPTNYVAAWIHRTLGGAQVIGLGNGTATAHLIAEIAQQVGVSPKDVTALTIGNDHTTYPLPHYCRVNGIPLTQLMSETDAENLCGTIAQRYPYTANTEWTLVSHILQVVSAIALDKRRVMSVGTRIATEMTSVYLNVPAQIGHGGVTAIVPLDLTDTQRQHFTELVAESAADQAL